MANERKYSDSNQGDLGEEEGEDRLNYGEPPKIFCNLNWSRPKQEANEHH